MKRHPLSRHELALRNPVARALGARPMLDTAQRQLNVMAHAAFDEVMHGRGAWDHIDTLAMAVNVSLVLCERDYGADLVDHIHAAQDALMHARRRAGEGKSFGFDDLGAQALRVGLDIHQQQLALAGRAAYLEVIQEVSIRAAQGHVLQVARIPSPQPAPSSATGA